MTATARLSRKDSTQALPPGKGAHGLQKKRRRGEMPTAGPVKKARRSRGRVRRSLPVRILFGLVSLIVTVAITLLAVFILGMALLGATGRYRTSTILTGSMANIYPPGTVVLLERQPAELVTKDQIVAFVPPQAGVPVLHRVIKIIDEKADRGGVAEEKDTSAGAGANDSVARVENLIDDSVPGLDRADRPAPLVVTKGDNNPIIDTWSPVRLEGDVYTPIAVPFLAPNGVVSFGKVLRFLFEYPLASRLIGGIAMLLFGWPFISKIWSTSRHKPSDWVQTDDEEVVRNSRRWSAVEGRGGVTVAPDYARALAPAGA